MAFFYSAERAGFFDDTVHDVLPSDAVPITTDRHAQLLAGQSQGLMIVGDENGAPVTIEPPGPTPEQALEAMRAERDRLLDDSDRTQVSDRPMSDEDRAAWATYRQQLRDLPETFIDPAAVVWPVAPA